MPTPVFQQLGVVAVKYGSTFVPWTGTLTTAAMQGATEISFQPRVNDVGVFSFKDSISPGATPAVMGGVDAVASTDPLLPNGTIVVFTLTESAANAATAGDASSGYLPLAGVIEKRSVDWTSGEAPTVTYTGRTWGALLDDVVVYPYGGLDARPYTDARVFSWASPGYDDSAWAAAKQITTQGTSSAAWTLDSGQSAPDGWPYEPNAYWIWSDNPGGAGHSPSGSSTSTTSAAAIGTCLFRKSWTPSAAARYAIFVTADNYYVMYLNGVEIAANRENIYGWQTTTRYDVQVTSGTHILAVRGENVGGLSSNPAGVLVTVKKVNASGTLTAEIVSDNSWVCKPYVAAPLPGWTAGHILEVLRDEALARDTSNLSALRAHTATYTWDDVNDSDGNAFGELPEVSFPVGSTFLDAVRTLKTQGGVCWLDVPRPPASIAGAVDQAIILNVYNAFPAQVNKAAFVIGTSLFGLVYDSEG